MRMFKETGVEWIGKIPWDWEVVILKKCCDLCKGLPITKADLIKNGSPVISYGQIHSKNNKWTVISKDLIRYVDDSYNFSNPSALAQVGSIIFADTSEDYEGIGNCIYVNLGQGIFAGYHTIIVRPFNIYYPKYLAFLFQTDCWRSQLRSSASGIKVFSVTQKMLRNTTLIVPPNTKQQRIADYLDSKCSKIDTIIEKQQAVIEKLKEYKLSVITEAVTKGLNPDVEMKDSGVEWIGEVPKHWRIIRVKWLLAERKERSKSGDEEPLSMSQKYGLIPTKEMDRVPNLASSYVDAKIVYPNDLVFNKLKAHLGVFAVSKYYGVVSPDYSVYYTNNKVDLKYLEYLFKTPQCILEFIKKSSGVADGLTRLYTDGLYSIKCPYPNLEEQNKISAFLNNKCITIDSSIIRKQSIISKLLEYKKSLIYEVVTGKKEV